MTTHRPRLFLLDAYALIYRAFHSFGNRPLIDSQGRNTSAVLGFLLTLEELLSRERPEMMAVAFDLSGPTFRHQLYPDYKATRDETPEGIRFAVPYIKQLLTAYGIPMISQEGYEADDVIGTVARLAEAEGIETYMVTPDKDYAQLVTSMTYMYKPLRGGGYERWGEEQVLEHFKLQHTQQMIDYLGLVGDTADNLPGCKGIGPVGASKLLSEFGSIDAIYQGLSSIKGKAREHLEHGREAVYMTRELATICTSVPLEIDWQSMRPTEPNREALRALYTELEFRTHLAKLYPKSTPEPAVQAPEGDLFASQEPSTSPSAPSSPEAPDLFSSTESGDLFAEPKQGIEGLNWQWLRTPEEVATFVQRAREQGIFAFDTETTGLDFTTSSLVVFSFALSADEAYVLMLPEGQDEAETYLSLLRPLFADPKVTKVAQNAKFDLQYLLNHGIEVCLPLFDTMIAHYLLQPDMRHGLDLLSETYLGISPMSYEAMVAPQSTANADLRQVDPDRLGYYAAEDAALCWMLYQRFAPELGERALMELFETIEMPLIPVLVRMEREGVRLDVEILRQKAQEMHAHLERIGMEIEYLAGHPLNVNSSKQVGEVLFDELGLSPKPKKTKSGGYTTGEEALEKIRTKHPIVGKILEYRGLKKLLSTYIDPLPEMLRSDGRLHASFNQAVTSTGRLSCSNPNIQNIPIRTEEGRGIRAAFVPHSSGDLFLSADYSQIELRLMAAISGDEAMIGAFLSGQDVHRATAAKIHQVPIDKVTTEMRRQAKTANFGINYGISAFGLADRLAIPRADAKRLIDGYFASYPGVEAYMKRVVEEARELGYVQTIMGRKRYLPDIKSSNAVVRGYAERNAINAPLQGSAADIIKLAMIRIDEAIRSRGLSSRLILQVHDELNFNVPPHELEEMKQLVHECMTGAVSTLAVPLEVEIGVGKSWLEAH